MSEESPAPQSYVGRVIILLFGVIVAVAGFLGSATIGQGREISELQAEMRERREEARYVRQSLDMILRRLESMADRQAGIK